MSGQLKMGVTSVSVGINYLRIYSVKVMCVCVCVSLFLMGGDHYRVFSKMGKLLCFKTKKYQTQPGLVLF